MKIKKVHQAKKYKHNVNRKRLNKTRSSTGKIKCDVIKEYWNDKRTCEKNFKSMGLAMDPNKSIPIPNHKQERIQLARIVNGSVMEEDDDDCKVVATTPAVISEVIEKLEDEVAAPRVKKFRLPKAYIQRLIYFIDKYKFDYNAMVLDRQNHDQWTNKQFRQRIQKYISIPEQFDGFLKARDLSMEDIGKWKESNVDSDLVY